jgi:ligand-binding sensor domain-containing protein
VPGASVEGPWLPARRIRALASHGDRIWLATDAGLVAVDASPGGPVIGAPVSGPRGPAWSLARDGDRLFAGTDRAVWSLGPDGWSRAGSLGSVGGPITALTALEGVLWIGDPDGVTRWDRDSGEQRRFTFSAGDLPAGVRGETFVSDISVATADQVWVATPAGAVRLLVD